MSLPRWRRPLQALRTSRPAGCRPRLERLEDRCVPTTTPNDPLYGNLYGAQRINADEAWDVTTGSPTTVVAVNDTGIDYTHPDLYLNIWINQDEIPASVRAQLTDTDHDGIISFWDLNARNPNGSYVNAAVVSDFNGNGYIDAGDLLDNRSGWEDGIDQDPTPHGSYVDDIVGWNFVNDTNNPFDDNSHGTHVAGTIGAVGNNGVGVTGVCWQCSLMPVKWLNANGGGDLNDGAAALYYAADNGARVSNNSWGYYFGGSNDVIARAIRDVQAQGHIVVAAAGNDGLNNDTSRFRTYPAAFPYDNIVAVAATNSADKKASFSNYGAKSVDLGAPGVNVVSTVPGGYASYSGTSMATPQVTGTIALMLTVNPSLSPTQVRSILVSTADPTRSLQGKTVSGGRLDAYGAVTLAQGTTGTFQPTGTTATAGTTATGGGSSAGIRGVEAGADAAGAAALVRLFQVQADVAVLPAASPAADDGPNIDAARVEAYVADDHSAAPPPAFSRHVAADALFALLGELPARWELADGLVG